MKFCPNGFTITVKLQSKSIFSSKNNLVNIAQSEFKHYLKLDF